MNILEYIKVFPNKRIVNIKDASRKDLASLFKDLGFTRGVEIGTEKGKYAYQLCRSNPDLRLWCIDPYEFYADGHGYKDNVDQKIHENNFYRAKDRLARFNCEIVRNYSRNAVDMFADGSLDFVYIDGNHKLEYVIEDLTLWTPKVRVGGIIAGHDYIKLRGQHFSHVPYAVEAYMRSYFIFPLFVLDNKNNTRTEEENAKMDRIRSWFFIKQ